MVIKIVRSENYNYNFNKETGLFARWGKTEQDDPDYSPLGPELLDIEISTICHGVNGQVCGHCYKSNTPLGENMSFETFKQIFHKIPKNLTQIAFGIGDINGNPNLKRILRYCRYNNYNSVVPNITINGDNLTNENATMLAGLCGAVAVSNYNKNICYGAVEKLSDLIGKGKNTLKQVNIHQLASEETYLQCKEVIRDSALDSRLKNLNAIVFLSLKQKGRGEYYHPLPNEKFKEIIDLALGLKTKIGMDSCSAAKFLWSIQGHPNFDEIKKYVEPCESGLFSLYVNVHGVAYFCSFLENYQVPVAYNLCDCNDFLKEVWEHSTMSMWRHNLFETAKKNPFGCRECPIYKI